MFALFWRKNISSKAAPKMVVIWHLIIQYSAISIPFQGTQQNIGGNRFQKTRFE
jgi:hypothetical protein